MPGYAIYEYTANGALGTSQWISPGSGTIKTGANSSDVTILWNGGPVVGKAMYQVNANYIWDLEVNVVQIKISSANNSAAYPGASIIRGYGCRRRFAMKGLPLVLLFGMLLSLAAYANDPLARITFRVTDDFGNAVTGAPVVVTTGVGWIPGPGEGRTELREARGLTDKNGVAVLELPCKTGNIRSYSVLAEDTHSDNNKMKIGDAAYYRDMGGEFRFTNVVGGQWQPWNPTVAILLKGVMNPIPMFARSFVNSRPRLQVPEFDKAVGFDLMKGDLVAPHGKGEIADLHVKLIVIDLGQRKIDRGPMFDATFAVTFTNAGDGIQEFFSHPRMGSALLSPRFAPETGYTSVLVKTSYEHETESRHEKREDLNYFFRVRTKKDEKGKLVSALYGKIHGDFRFDERGRVAFTYYLNPTPNDRNMEFDPERNLFKNLSSFEEVRAP